MNFLIVGLGGFLGACARYGVYLLMARWVVHPFPAATLLINVVASLLAGLLFGLAAGRVVPASVFLFAAMGFLGAFSTFSTWAVELDQLWRDGQWVFLIVNVVASLSLGLAAAAGGRWLAAG